MSDKEQMTKLVRALNRCIEEMDPITEPCDHSVGICWCSWHAALDEAVKLRDQHRDLLDE